MNKTKGITSVMLALSLALGGCATDKPIGEKRFENSGFERGTLRGWTAEGAAFGDECVSVDNKDADGNYYYKEGEFFFSGGKAPKGTRGTLTSETFTIEGDKIGFLIGAGSDPDKCYVSIVDEKGNELARRGNDEFGMAGYYNSMHRVVIDVSAHKGKKAAVKIVDNDAGNDNFNYLNVDDFILNYQGETEEVSKTKAADKYISENSSKINAQYRHTYHAMPPVGWMNDPNGFGYAFGKYQLFYQFHPYSSAWGPMHWGHYQSSDLVKWELMPTALAPDTAFDANGCFSGTSIVHNDKMYLMYTAVLDPFQTQALAVSDDGIKFTKRGRVISSDATPPDSSKNDFRDPKVFRRGDSFYALIGSKSNAGEGQILLYKSADLMQWQYVGVAHRDRRTNGIYECPDLATFGDKDVLITSPQGFATNEWRHENLHSNLYMVGNLNTETGKFTVENEDEIDSGLDFYAPQTMSSPDGRTIMIAWMQMWSRSLPTQAHGWAGAMILPRELSLVNGKLYQKPIREIEAYRQNKVEKDSLTVNGEASVEGVEGTTVELSFTLDMGTASRAGVKIFAGLDHETLVYYDKATDLVVIDRSECGVRITGDGKEKDAAIRHAKVDVKNNSVTFRIFLDKSSAEVFINDGERTLTSNVYSSPSDTGIKFFSQGGAATVRNLTKYDIVVD